MTVTMKFHDLIYGIRYITELCHSINVLEDNFSIGMNRHNQTLTSSARMINVKRSIDDLPWIVQTVRLSQKQVDELGFKFLAVGQTKGSGAIISYSR